ncbi:MAG: hypothetical protein Q8S22_12165, partial [Eubacteriales bacterium]|nr:hypothetical protein [Eubacteriales bacterium]
MTEQAGKNKSGNEMRSAAIVALLGVIGLCVLFLLIALPLRALRGDAEPEVAVITPAPSPTAPPTPSPTPYVPSVLTFDVSAD